MDRPVATKTEKEKKRKCSVLTKHVKEYIKKEEEDKKKTKTIQKQKKPRKTTNPISVARTENYFGVLHTQNFCAVINWRFPPTLQ